ncbi:hypothetical protein BOW07_06830 [Solemya velum gill symbiont]|nr:hypothetical protein BOV99_04945 [Solemya velum gill symbiont]OOY57922.1 hypothetical protein BOW00_05010 [Solemya velum gill symbiont]OOY69845.1 hypothetical protein BOW07_06830 [Solemya velum gill symbiont]OOY94576.1 hypothetical protein BOW17_05770 [Solemya velum gill symbiont]
MNTSDQNSFSYMNLILLLATMLLMLSACGGGGGGGSTPVANIIPNAVAGGDQQVTEGDSVTLDGTESSDPDGNITGYVWQQIAGTSVGSLNDAGEGKVSFTAPNGDHDLTFQLTVTDNDTANDTDTVNVAVSAQSVSNLAPTANAGDDIFADEGDVVSLDGRASSDSDGTVDHYQWSLFNKDTGESDPVLAGASSAEATATLPASMTTDTVYTYKLTVTDNLGATNSDYVDITANANPVTGQTVSGSIAIPPGNRVDLDTLDPNTTPGNNDSIGFAQSMPNPAVVGGYSRNSDDEYDYYSATLSAGEAISLLIGRKSEADLDLYLKTLGGTTVDASLSYDSDESVTVPSSGTYIIEVHAWSGASAYHLVIGENATAVASNGYRLSDDFVADEVLVRHKPAVKAGVELQLDNTLMTNLGMVKQAGQAGDIQLYRVKPQKNLQAFADSQLFSSRVRTMSSSQQQKYETLTSIKLLASDPSVAFAEPNRILKPLATPNDTDYGLQWHYPQIGLPAAWDETYASSAKIAVIDTGVLLSHPDLTNQLSADGYDFISSTSISAYGDGIDNNPDDPGDSSNPGVSNSSFHGTHVAGTVAAESNNSIGGAGVTWKTSSQIVPVRVLGVGGGTTYDVLQGVKWASGQVNDAPAPDQLAAPVDVINLSLGGSGSCGVSEQAVYSAAKANGVTVVVAAGNSGGNAANFSPANCDDVLTVSAVGYDKSLAYYSNFGLDIDVAAPGGNMSQDLDGNGDPDGVYSTLGDDTPTYVTYNYDYYHGTSMATPHVAGVIGLMKSANNTLTPDDIEAMLINGYLTEDIGPTGFDTSFGHGLIRADLAVTAAKNPPVIPPNLAVYPGVLDFGSIFTLATLTASNTGASGLNIIGVSDNQSWLTVTEPETTDGLGTYTVHVDRSGLSAGTHNATISFDSNNNDINVNVSMSVGPADASADVGYIYVQLIDAGTDSVVDTVTPNGSGAYSFTGVQDGDYKIVAGTDYNNDGAICSRGEACGAYTSLYDQQTVNVSGSDESGNNFTVGHDVAFTPASAAR